MSYLRLESITCVASVCRAIVKIASVKKEMDAEQRKLYNKLKKRESRSRMSKEEKESERNAAKVGMQEYRLNMSDEEYKYHSLNDKHRKRNKKKNQDEIKRTKENIKAKESMRRLRQKSPDTYIPRGKKNIPEDTDWKAFISKSEKTKELMTKRNPEVAKRITKMIEEENLEKVKKKKN